MPLDLPRACYNVRGVGIRHEVVLMHQRVFILHYLLYEQTPTTGE